MLPKSLFVLVLWGGFPLVAHTAPQQFIQLQTSSHVSAYEQDGVNVWSYDYGTEPVAIENFEKYFILLQEGKLTPEQMGRVKYNAFKGNVCKFWTGDWLIATTSQFDKGKATAAPKPHIAYPPQTGWALRLPILQPIPLSVSNLVITVPVVLPLDGQEIAVELSNHLVLQWLMNGKVLDTRSVHPMLISKGDDKNSPLMKIFTIPDQQFEIAKEANYTVRLLGTHRSPLVKMEEQSSSPVPFEITEAVMKFNACSSTTRGGKG